MLFDTFYPGSGATKLLLQDYSKFLEENFDSKEWINNAFRAPKETEKEVNMQNIAPTL
jgi:hypothetical protein